MKCTNCESQYDKLISLSVHYRKVHNGTAKQLRIDLFHGGKQPTCACGCGTPTKFMSIEKGFTEYAWGHQAKVKNNWGHNEEARVKSLKKRRDEGLWSKDPWNRGKTKEDDTRLADAGKKISERHGERYSELMSKNRLSGVIPTLSGSAHSRWKGGTSELSAMCRSHLYRAWSFPKMVESGFKCTECGATRDLEVHHDGERFAAILQKGIETLGEPGDDFDRKACFVEWVLWYHANHDVSGQVLCSQCHEATHRSTDQRSLGSDVHGAVDSISITG